eukprot:1201794-Rhodomonas_salina.3
MRTHPTRSHSWCIEPRAVRTRCTADESLGRCSAGGVCAQKAAAEADTRAEAEIVPHRTDSSALRKLLLCRLGMGASTSRLFFSSLYRNAWFPISSFLHPSPNCAMLLCSLQHSVLCCSAHVFNKLKQTLR